MRDIFLQVNFCDPFDFNAALTIVYEHLVPIYVRFENTFLFLLLLKLVMRELPFYSFSGLVSRLVL